MWVEASVSAVANAVLICLLTACIWYAWHLHRSLQRMTELRKAERKGRTSAERKLRESLSETKPTSDESSGVDWFHFRGIGVANTPFKDKRGTPRQGSLLKLPCQITLHSWLQPQLTLDGIQEFSHIWVIFVFSENTNDHKLLTNRNPKRLGCKSRVIPPRMKDGRSKVGIFATRAPHRPNPLGMTLVRVHSIDVHKGSMIVYGADFVDGTPIVDIKPYLPYADTVKDGEQSSVASWVRDDCGVLRVDHVSWMDSAMRDYRNFESEGCEESMIHFHSLSEWKSAMDGVLSYDIRNRNQRTSKFQSRESRFECTLDCFRVWYHIATDPDTQLTSLQVANMELIQS